MKIWAETLEQIEHRPIAGWGAGVTLETLTANPLSTHNGYLQIWLQLGVVGLILKIAFLVTLLLALFKRHNRVSRMALAVLLGLIVHDVFEVALLQNNTTLTLLMWLIIGIGISTRGGATQPSQVASARGGQKEVVKAMAR